MTVGTKSSFVTTFKDPVVSLLSLVTVSGQAQTKAILCRALIDCWCDELYTVFGSLSLRWMAHVSLWCYNEHVFIQHKHENSELSFED